MNESQNRNQKRRRSPAAIGALFSSTGEILLVKRRDIPIWVLPGGGIEFGENPSEAVLREILEETGIKACLERLVGIYRPANALARALGSEAFLYRCSPLEGSLCLSDETCDVGYFSLDKLPTPLLPTHYHWLMAALPTKAPLQTEAIPATTYTSLLTYALLHPYLTLRYALTLLGKTKPK